MQAIPCISRLNAALLVAGLALAPASAMAYHPLKTDDTGTQGQGGHQFEIGYDYGDDGTTTSGEIPLTYTYGATDAIDVFVGVGRVVDPIDGWGNIGLGAKWRFYEDEASKLSVAIKPEMTVGSSSAANRGTGDKKSTWGTSLIVSKETGFGELQFNLGYEHNPNNGVTGDRENLWRVSVAPVWAVAEGWKVALDLGLQTNADRTEKNRMGFIGAGVVYSPSEAMDVSFGVFRDVMDGAAENTTATFGLTFRF